MTSDQLCEWIRHGGSARERAIQIIHKRFFYLVRRVGVREIRLSYEDAQMAYSDAVTELDSMVRGNVVIEDCGKMLYTLVYRRCVDIVRKRTTKTKVEPLDHGQLTLDLPQWLLDALQHSTEAMQELFEVEDASERQQRQQRILACVKMAVDGMPPKRRALLVDKLDGYDYEELTQLHGFKTEDVAREMVSRAMQSLRSALKDACLQQQPICRDLCAWLRRKQL